MERVLSLPHSSPRVRRRWARTALVFVALLGAVSMVLLAFTPAASAQEAPASSAPERLARAQADAAAALSRYEQAVAEREQTRAQISELAQTISATRAEEAALRSKVTRRAVALYKNTDPTGGLSVFDTSEPMDAGRKTKFNEAADKYYEKRAAELHEQADRQQQEQVDLDKRRTELDDDIPRLEREKADAEQKIAKIARGVEMAEQLAPLRALGEPVMGPTVLNASEMAAWLRSTARQPGCRSA
jgi:septal ring factor EnvC (AmiA/AmiB activator)